MTGRTVEQLHAWVELLELCDDDCETFRTTAAMRQSVLAAEQELHRLHQVEALIIRFAAFHVRIKNDGETDQKWDELMCDLCNNVDAILAKVEELIPGALNPETIEAMVRQPLETLVSRRSLKDLAECRP